MKANFGSQILEKHVFRRSWMQTKSNKRALIQKNAPKHKKFQVGFDYVCNYLVAAVCNYSIRTGRNWRGLT